MKEKIETFKKLWANPRYKAIIQLLLWISFFFIMYLVICIINIFSGPVKHEPVNIPTKTAIENYTEMANYEYKYTYNYTINKENTVLTIEGTKYNDHNTFKLNGTKYTVKDNLIFDINNNPVTNLTEYDITNLYPNNINTLLTTAKNKEETKYNDGNIKTEYTFDDIFITTHTNNNYITNIELDITNYMIKINPKITHYTIDIEYQNINNIDSFNEL